MKDIGERIGVNESRVSQLHARAVQRLRKILTAGEQPPAKPVRPRLVRRTHQPRIAAKTVAKRQTTTLTRVA